MQGAGSRDRAQRRCTLDPAEQRLWVAGREPFKKYGWALQTPSKTPPRCTPHCAEAGKLGSAAKPRASCEHLLRAPATNTWPGLAAATALEVTPSSSRGRKPRLRPIARESVRLRFELRRLLRICLAVCRKGERGNIQNGLVWRGWGSSAGPGGSSGSHPAWRAPVS